MKVTIPVSVGELLDKISILEIKAFITDDEYIHKELNELNKIINKQIILDKSIKENKKINIKKLIKNFKKTDVMIDHWGIDLNRLVDFI